MTVSAHATHRPAARLARALARLGAVVIALRLTAAVAGPPVAAIVGAALILTGGVRCWARVEHRLFDAAPPPVQPVHPARLVDEHRHLAFARALATVAARYLAECEAETGAARAPAVLPLDDLDHQALDHGAET
jgi:hypothetical protein